MATEETAEKFRILIEKCIEWVIPKRVDVKNEVTGDTITKDINEKNVFIDQFFVEQGYYRQKRSKIFEEYPYLEDEYNKLKELQELKLQNLGLFKRTSEGLTKFMLTNLYKDRWQDKVVNENTHEVRDFSLKDLVGFRDKTE